MNRAKLKNYAPQARRDFIQAVTDRAAQYGLTASNIEPMTESGNVVLIAGKPFPKALGDKRKRLVERFKKHGFEPSIEALAYTWFNRLVAIRYMELHGYLEHGFRVLSHPDGHAQPEILEKAQYVDLPGLDQKKVIELKLDGTKEEELYRLLLTAQFNALSKAMPFLFEKIDDESELLLPDNLLNSDSLIRKLVSEIDEEDWKKVEIIGWLYQFYISEKKDEVIGKVVKSEDIPAATQLFTPNWIVKYLVQNTLGRQWLATYPQSSLRSKMEYYIEPAEQTPEVQEQLKAITPISLNPEELTLLDPACGSGHILVEAYDLFKAIYEERGYRAKDIPALILQKNLFGLEIDDRAAQLAAFALMMKARADDRHLFTREGEAPAEPVTSDMLGKTRREPRSPVQPNILAFVESKGLDAEEIHYALLAPLPGKGEAPAEPPRPDGFLFETEDNLFTHAAEANAVQAASNRPLTSIAKEDIASLIALFENAKTFGSLIQISPDLAVKLPEIEKRLIDALIFGDLTHSAAHVLKPLFQQARFLCRQYDAVIANPPYMNSSGMTAILKAFIAATYSNEKADLFAAFIAKGFQFAKECRHVGFVAMQSWMYLKTFEAMRICLLSEKAIVSLAHLGPRAFSSISGEVVSVAAFCCVNAQIPRSRPVFLRLVDGDEDTKRSNFHSTSHRIQGLVQADFRLIPGSPISYWASDTVRQLFASSKPLVNLAAPRQGLATTRDDLFIRQWYEVSHANIGFNVSSEDDSLKSGRKWFPLNKGGGFRKWFGNNGLVVNYKNKGKEVCDYIDSTPGARVGSNGRVINRRYYFQPGITWGLIAGSTPSFRSFGQGFIISHKGCGIFLDDSATRSRLLGYLNSCVASHLIEIISPSQGCEVGHLNRMPVSFLPVESERVVIALVEMHESDWNSVESGWGFRSSPLLNAKQTNISDAFHSVKSRTHEMRKSVRRLEEENNRLFIEAYGLQGELAAEVPEDQITLDSPDRAEDIKRLLSYAIGCAMGRYSIDKQGLIYADCGNEGFDQSKYKTFIADGDGIIPLLESDWGVGDDAANRINEFVNVCWPGNSTTKNTDRTDDRSNTDFSLSVNSVVKTSPCMEENLRFIEESLGSTIREYLAKGFYKHHLSMYKKRPIYWLFSSGKIRAFQCLVYLHRYNEGTLARMRTEYVIPLMGKMSARLEYLQGPPEQKGAGGEIAATSAVTVKRKLEKERDSLKKQIAELQSFDEKLRHYADLRIKLDLDDGVKINYGKFSDPEYGDILAEVKAICGTKDDD